MSCQILYCCEYQISCKKKKKNVLRTNISCHISQCCVKYRVKKKRWIDAFTIAIYALILNITNFDITLNFVYVYRKKNLHFKFVSNFFHGHAGLMSNF